MIRFRYVSASAHPHVAPDGVWYQVTVDFSVPISDGFRLGMIGHASGIFDSLEDAFRSAFVASEIGKHAEPAIPLVEPAIEKLAELFAS